jgi:hypothetical protein
MIGLARTLGQVFDLFVLHRNLLAQKSVLDLKECIHRSRDRSRLVGTCRDVLSLLMVAIIRRDIGRD